MLQELGKITPPKVQGPPKKTAEELQAILPSLITANVNTQTDQWNELKDSGTLQKFASANLQTFAVSLGTLEQRTQLTLDSLGLENVQSQVSLDDFKYATVAVALGSGAAGVASLAFLPENVGATACYVFALLPILFLALGSSVPGVIATAIVAVRGANGKEDNASGGATAQERICRHEAAHFCCGYWCGLPVAGYSVEEGVARVEFGVRSQEYAPTEVAALAVTALAGLVGEATKWEKAVGGQNDLLQLDQVFRQSAKFMGAQVQQDVTRWGALTATLLLKQNEKQYEKVVEAFSRQAPLEECITILEA